MGSTTPFMSIYLPANGESNYADAFNAGMINVDQHDHSGGPDMGVPIGTTALADGSVTYQKLNANVADTTTGIATSGSKPNQLVLEDPLKSIYTLGQAASVGFLVLNGTTPDVRTFQNTSTINWTNANGTGNPSAVVNVNGFATWSVSRGGTGATSFNPNCLITGGATLNTDPLQSLPDTGNLGDNLTSQGPGVLPTWVSPLTAGYTQTVKVSLSNAQLKSLTTPVVLVPAKGAGTAIIPLSLAIRLNSSGVAFNNTAAGVPSVTWNGNTANPSLFNIATNFFQNTTTCFTIIYQPSQPFVDMALLSAIPVADFVNKDITFVATVNMTAGGTSTADLYLTYYVITL